MESDWKSCNADMIIPRTYQWKQLFQHAGFIHKIRLFRFTFISGNFRPSCLIQNYRYITVYRNHYRWKAKKTDREFPVRKSVHIRNYAFALLGRPMLHITDGDIRKQRRNGAVASLWFRLRNLDIQPLGVNLHILGNDLYNIVLDHFHHIRWTIRAVWHQEQFQTVFCYVTGTLSFEKIH